MSIVAKRYAVALMNLSAKAGEVEQVAAALDDLAATVAESAELGGLLTDPKVPLATREAVIGQVVERSQVPPLVATFVRFVTHKRRIGLLDEMRREFHELADERMGRAHAHVTVAAELTDEQTQALQDKLSGLSGKEVKLQVQIDPELLGGVVARIGSTVWDGSLRNQLHLIHQSIMKG